MPDLVPNRWREDFAGRRKRARLGRSEPRQDIDFQGVRGLPRSEPVQIVVAGKWAFVVSYKSGSSYENESSYFVLRNVIVGIDTLLPPRVCYSRIATDLLLRFHLGVQDHPMHY